MLDITVETKHLIHALAFANSVVEKRNVSVELSSIKLSVKGNFLEIVATDMDLTLTQQVGVKVRNEGQTTVSTKLLTDIVKKITDEEIILKQNGDSYLELIGKNCNFSLLTLPVERFPAVEEIKAESVLKIPCSDFARIIDYTAFSMSLEETRYNLNGVYLHVKNGEFCGAATDGHRLSVASVAISKPAQEFGVILPRKTVEEIQKIVKDPQNSKLDIEIWLATNKIKFVCAKIIMVSKLIDGTFPEYNSFIPATSSNKLIVSTELLAGAINRVATITVEKFRAIKMLFGNDLVEISASGEAQGKASERLTYSEEKGSLCSYVGNKDIAIGFNPKYLTDVLQVIKVGQIEFCFNDGTSPALIKATDSSQDSFVIMPVKV